jgi:hypothetical protein
MTNGEETQLIYKPPVGDEVCSVTRKVKIGSAEFELDAKVYLAREDLDQAATDRREGGLLILDEYDSALDLGLFRFDADPDAAKIFGEVVIRGLREALRSNENIVTEERDGLNRNDSTAQALIKEIESILEPVVRSEREKTAKATRKLSSAAQKRVNTMLEELNKLAAEYTGTGTSPGVKQKHATGNDVDTTERTKPHPDLMEFIPRSVTLTAGSPAAVSLYVNTKACSGEAIIESDNDDLDFTPESFTIETAEDVFHQVVHLRCDIAGSTGAIVVVTDAGEAELSFKVEDIPYPIPADGLEFIPGSKDVVAGKGRSLDLYMDVTKVAPHSNVVLELEDTSIADLVTTSIRVDPDKARGNIVHAVVKVIGRQVGAKTRVIATVGSLSAVCHVDVRSRKAKARSTGGLFAGVAFEDRPHYPKIMFRPDDEYMVINTKEPSFELIGVSEASFGTDRGVQVAVAEACTQLACVRIAERTVPGGGKRPWYLSTEPVKRMQEDRVFIELLTQVAGPVIYRNLVTTQLRGPSNSSETHAGMAP